MSGASENISRSSPGRGPLGPRKLLIKGQTRMVHYEEMLTSLGRGGHDDRQVERLRHGGMCEDVLLEVNRLQVANEVEKSDLFVEN